MENIKTKSFNTIKGSEGEKRVAEFIKKSKKFKIIATNYKNKIGEIDIIAKYKKIIIFIEVKTRTSFMFGRPIEAVDKYKQEKIRQIAELYLVSNKLENQLVRFDVAEVFDNFINYVENAF